MSDINLKPCPNPECGSEAIYGCHVPLADAEDGCPAVVFLAYECHMCGERGPIAKKIEEAARLWNLLPREVEWISVEDGNLPKAGNKVWCQDKHEDEAYKGFYAGSGIWHNVELDRLFADVTYYQPLPLPPKDKP